MSANNLTRDEARRRAGLVSDLHYDVILDLTQGDEVFGCETTVRFRCAEPGAATFVDFLPHDVQAIELNDSEIGLDALDESRITIEGLAAENELRVRATCDYGHTGVGLSHFRDPLDERVYLHTQFETFDAHRVYPCFDQPDLKATFSLSVLAPAEWTVVSNMKGEAKEDGAARRWTFTATPPISTYITAVVAGPYHDVHDRHGDIDLGLYCRQSLARYLDPGEIFEITKQGLDFYQEAFDYPYELGKYDQLFVPEFSAGAMENLGCVTFHESFVFRSKVTEAARERRAEVILHEMAHMWFGDLVTMKWWDDLWLNESFATFMAQLSQVRATRFTNSWTTFANDVKSSARRQDQLPTTHPIAADVPDIESVYLNFDAITYEKGASVLRQLVAWVGEESFLESCRGYFRRHEYANAALSDFLTALEEGSGRDLTAWSREWLETAGLNTLRAEVSETDGNIDSLAVIQEAEPDWPTLRSQRIGLGLYDLHDGTLSRRRAVELDVVGARTEVPDLAGERLPDLLLVNDGDLGYAKLRLDPRSLRTVTDHLRDLSDPLARALCWGAAWDMLRDAELPAREHLRLVLNNIEGETDIGVLQSLLDQASSAAVVFGAPDRVEEALLTLANHSRGPFETSEPGSDFQLAWARAFVAAARIPEHVSSVKGLLGGNVVYDGLEVDTDLRWLMVVSLAATGAGGDDIIEAELERDPTDAGGRYAATARAARPTAEAKAEAWEAITTDTSLPLATLRSMMSGFQRAEQTSLLEPYARRYFEILDPVWRDRDIEVALALARNLYPRVVVSDEVLGLTGQRLADEHLPGPIRRILLEGRDQMARVARARRRDAEAAATG